MQCDQADKPWAADEVRSRRAPPAGEPGDSAAGRPVRPSPGGSPLATPPTAHRGCTPQALKPAAQSRARHNPLTIAAIAASTVFSACADEGELAATWQIVTDQPLDLPIAGLDAANIQRFIDGDAAFDRAMRPADGLGPLYIRDACAACHREGGRGLGAVQKFGAVDVASPPTLPYGNAVRPLLAGGGKTPLVPGQDAKVKLSLRLGPQVWGRGYLEAVDDAVILAVAAQQSKRTDGVHGQVQTVAWVSESIANPPFHNYKKGQANLIGRFGFKARQPTLDDFSADALQGDMGLTSPLRPTELPNPDNFADDAKPGVDVSTTLVHVLADYVRLLAIPPRAKPDPAGAALFEAVGCAVCHVPSLKTRADYPIPALAGMDAPVYTDLLLHDMGDELSDGIGEFTADARQWRTAPLIGMAYTFEYLHDGRAKDLHSAIMAHKGTGSQGNPSVQAYEALTPAQRSQLIEFVRGL